VPGSAALGNDVSGRSFDDAAFPTAALLSEGGQGRRQRGKVQALFWVHATIRQTLFGVHASAHARTHMQKLAQGHTHARARERTHDRAQNYLHVFMSSGAAPFSTAFRWLCPRRRLSACVVPLTLRLDQPEGTDSSDTRQELQCSRFLRFFRKEDKTKSGCPSSRALCTSGDPVKMKWRRRLLHDLTLPISTSTVVRLLSVSVIYNNRFAVVGAVSEPL
jgi:hypothetical protein